MLFAIVNNRADFVRLLLEHGVNLQDLLTVDTLLHLYKDVRLKLYFYILLHIFAYLMVLSALES